MTCQFDTFQQQLWLQSYLSFLWVTILPPHSPQNLFPKNWVKNFMLTFLCIIGDQIYSSTIFLRVLNLLFFTDFSESLSVIIVILFRCISKHHFIILVNITTTCRSICSIFEAPTSFVVLILLILAKSSIEIIVDIMSWLFNRRPHQELLECLNICSDFFLIAMAGLSTRRWHLLGAHYYLRVIHFKFKFHRHPKTPKPQFLRDWMKF